MLVLVSLGLPAFAINPTSDVHIGQEPVRHRAVQVGQQMRLRGSDAWQQFLNGDGADWLVRFDERTGTPHVAWGPGIPLGDMESDSALEAATTSFLSQHQDLMGVDLQDLRMARIVRDPERGQIHVYFDQVVPGSNALTTAVDWGGDQSEDVQAPDWSPEPVPVVSEALQEMAQYGQPRVWRGGVQLRIQHGKLTMFRMDTYPEANEVNTTPQIQSSQAIEIAIQEGPEPNSAHAVDGAVLVVLPLDVPGDLEYRLTWLVRSSTHLGTGHPGQWVSFVDAHTGELINVHNQIRFTTGTVYGEHDTRTVNGDMSVSPMPFVPVYADDDSGETDFDGVFDLSGGSFETDLEGNYFEAVNDSGADGQLSFSGTEGTWTDDDASQAEISSYVFLHHVWEWGEYYAPEVGITNTRIVTTLNIDSACNAYYDGNVNFYRSGSGCNNTGRIADVNYHEWGHGFHAYSADTWYVDGSIGEGASDVVAFFQTGDALISPYFYTNGGGIRNASDDRVYPDDYVSDQVHSNGLIFAGAIWDLWGLLEDDLGADEGYDQTVELFVSALKTNPTTADTYDAVFAADDDNGDLGDGTPNQCSIIDAFALHGLGPGGSTSQLELAHEGLENQGSGVDGYGIEAELVNLAPLCTEIGDAEIRVFYSTDGGEDYNSVELSLDDDWVEGSIPGQEDGTIVHYYLQAETEGGDLIWSPSGGSITPFTFLVGEMETIYCNDFEDDDGGFTHELLSGEETEGADDWQWGAAGGLGGDPDFAWSGSRLWGNDISPDQQWNGEYQNDKHNRLTSVPIQVEGYDRLVLEYRRWLTVEDGYYDQARILANGETVWENHATSRSNGEEHHQDEQWIQHVVELPEPDEDGNIEIAWDLETDGGLSMGGWNIDDVCVKGIVLPDDGDVSSSGDPDNPSGDDGSSDGTNTLNIEGGEITGCGCSTSGSSPEHWAILGGLLGLLGWRRRRID